jgi:hypothetical protein
MCCLTFSLTILHVAARNGTVGGLVFNWAVPVNAGAVSGPRSVLTSCVSGATYLCAMPQPIRTASGADAIQSRITNDRPPARRTLRGNATLLVAWSGLPSNPTPIDLLRSPAMKPPSSSRNPIEHRVTGQTLAAEIVRLPWTFRSTGKRIGHYRISLCVDSARFFARV